MTTWVVGAIILLGLGLPMFASYRQRLRPLRQAIREETPDTIKGLGACLTLILIQLVATAPAFVVGIYVGEGWGALTWIASLFLWGGVLAVWERRSAARSRGE